MNEIHFEWDDIKNISNINKHGIDFNEAVSVFYDENALIIFDPDHSEDEDRFVILGISDEMNILVVCHCYKEDDTIIRIISARKATPREERQYDGGEKDERRI